MNVLIIEDDLPLANVLAAMIRKFANRVIVAGTLGAARATLEKPNGFDVVFLDLNLPDSAANPTIQAIKWIRGTGRKVVVITGSDHPSITNYIALCGADGCFHKHDPDFVDKVIAQLKVPTSD